MTDSRKYSILPDEWAFLKSFTNARIALGRTGVSIPLAENLRFKLAHAHARDAVFSALAIKTILNSLTALNFPVYQVHSQAVNREVYLQRPDKGRILDETSSHLLTQLNTSPSDISLIISDGLSATAVNENAVLLIQRLSLLLKEGNYSMAPIIMAQQARVAIADEIGFLLHAKLTVNLIGERPGLSSVNGIGAYITYAPKPGLTDERRNCISNIRAEGLTIKQAADKIYYLIKQAFLVKTTGVTLKDNDTMGRLSNGLSTDELVE